MTALLGLASATALTAGCYTLQPAPVARVEPGTRIALDVNDAGRVALGGLIGPEIGQIEGRLVSRENGEYVVAVSSIRFLRGGEQTWAGERVSIKPEFVGTTYERRFHRGRTIALTTTIAAGVVALVISRDLLGLGSEGPVNPGDTAVTLRLPRP